MSIKDKKLKCTDCNGEFLGYGKQQKRCEPCQILFRNSGRAHTYNRICKSCDVKFKSSNGRAKECDNCFPKYTCLICGKDGIKDANHQKYCSTRCSNLAKADKYYDGNYSKVVKRDNENCRKCGSEKRLTAHHIDYSGFDIKKGGANNEMENLILLCDSCHQKLHVLTNRTLVKRYLTDTKAILKDFIG